ncbi:MAG: autotransporter outer membrane beta-barrel domain-containing protein [Parvibaculaceae bacterium]|nr:autotransporter outer membrane beta-barrel domain-containing protein [Parvibaculaceae bacterium]
MQKKMAQKLMFCGIGAVALIASTSAQASPGCDSANMGAFNQSTPANTNLLTQTGGTFDVGDTLFVTATGTPLGVGVDLLPGFDTLLAVNGANGMGSHTLTVGGPRTIDITLAGGPGGAAFLNFTCTPVATAPPTPTPPTTPTTPGGGTANGTEQSNTATNSTTTSVIVENGVVGGIIDGASQEDPDPSLVDIAAQEAADRLRTEQIALEDRQAELEADIKHFKENPETFGATGNFDAAGGTVFLGMANPLGLGKSFADSTADELDWLAGAELELKSNIRRQAEIEEKLKGLPTPNIHRDFTPADPEDLGDGENILFVGRDPFARALMRYRGFRLDVADTGEGFSDSVKPLSFTRTLSSTIVGWVRAVYTDYEQDDASQQEGDNILVALGIHKDFNEDLRIGLFATSTWGDVSSPVNNLDIDTTGYSLGAYGRYKWGEIDVNASTRIGLTDNDIAVSGTTGSYDTRLASFTFGISGQEQLSDTVWMRPAISVTNTWVNREDYVNSAGTAIGGNTTWTGNVSAGPTIGTSLTPPSGFKRLEPAIGLQATYNYSDQDTQAGTVTTSETDYFSLSVSPQLSMEFENGASLDVFGSYFGIGADLDGWSVGGTLSIPLN